VSFLFPTPAQFLGPELSCAVPTRLVNTLTPTKGISGATGAGARPSAAAAKGSAKGVSSVSYFPQSGHLLLTSSLDGSVKVWDTGASSFFGDSGSADGAGSASAAAGATRARTLREYNGHGAGVRRAVWSPDGRAIMTISHDKTVKIWDTETGAVVSRLRHERMTPVCGAFHPTLPGELLTGMHERAILQWDTRANVVAQRYPDHQAAVDTVTFLGADDDRFVSTGDDKKVLLWDYGVPVVLKEIFETELHAMPSVALHPSGNYLVGNAQNNQIAIFALQPKIKLNRKRHFSGHLSAGFACGLTFSPDGSTLCAGDAEGRLFFWDWRSGKLVKKLKAHEDVAIDVAWHPNAPRALASCSWDGSVKLWG
jgi:pre-mRNA-processing factor 17